MRQERRESRSSKSHRRRARTLTTTIEGNVDLASGDSEGIIKVEFPGYEPPFSQMITIGLVAYIDATAFPGGMQTDARWIKH